MHRTVTASITASILLSLVVLAMGCASTPGKCTCPCHVQHAAFTHQPPNARVAGYETAAKRAVDPTRYVRPSTVSSYRPRPIARPKAPTTPTYTTPRRHYSSASGYVRLRGSPVVHVRSCPKVLRSEPGGIVPARASDGPPCYTCRHAEAMRRTRNR